MRSPREIPGAAFCVFGAPEGDRSCPAGGIWTAGRAAVRYMHEQFANAFYSSGAWKRCRREFAKSRGYVCERCLKKGLIVAGTREQPLEVHHKIPLTPENIGRPEITLNWDNLELLCKDCHETERQRAQRRWRVDKDGTVTA